MPRPPALTDAERDEIVAFVRMRAGSEVLLDEEGWDSIVAIAGGRVYRFPRGEWALDRIRAETAFLQEFAPRSPIRVPVPQLFEDPLRAEYSVVPGRPLFSAVLAGWSSSERRRAARTLGSFLSVLHGFPVDRALTLGLKRDAWAEAWALGDDFRATVLPLLGSRGRELAERAVDVAEPSSLNPPRESVVHNDLGPEHILAKDRTICGVIDFGDVAVGDPALDFQWSVMYRQGGLPDHDPFVGEVIEHYAHPVDEDFFTRVATYRTYHGLRHVWDEHRYGDGSALREAIDMFEEAAKRLLT